MDGGNRPIFHHLPQRLTLAFVEDAWSAWRLAVQEAIRPLGVEPQHPVRTICNPTPPIRAASKREPPA